MAKKQPDIQPQNLPLSFSTASLGNAEANEDPQMILTVAIMALITGAIWWIARRGAKNTASWWLVAGGWWLVAERFYF